MFNTAAKRLLHIPQLRNIRHLESTSRPLAESLLEVPTGVNRVVKLHQDNTMLQLSIYATGFILHQQHFKLVSIQNITSALEEKEMEAWQNLIRVLTHEIVNSITPIVSLASTANDLLAEAGEDGHNVTDDVSADVHEAVQTIEKRSQGLLTFIENYRKLTRIPKPEFSIISLQDLFARIRLLLHEQFEEQAIAFQMYVRPETLEITADQALIEQVLINLCKNALEAVSGRKQPTVQLVGTLDETGGPVIKVIDNGPGIKGELVENIFIPFFTTKPDGSGIGLSLSRQIMRAHRGTLSVNSTPDVKTIFFLRF